MINIKTDECLPRLLGSRPAFCRVGRDEHDLYLDGRFHRLAGRYRNFRYTPVFLSGLRAPTALRVGMATEAIAADLCSRAGAKAYIAGPPAIVEAAIRVLLSRGMTPVANIHTDFWSLIASAAGGRARGSAGSREPTAAASASNGT